MINDSLKHLYWKTNANTFLGFKPGELVIVGYHSGGGFTGAPQMLEAALASGIAKGNPTPQPVEFPLPFTELEYRIGGRLWNGYHYFNPNLAR